MAPLLASAMVAVSRTADNRRTSSDPRLTPWAVEFRLVGFAFGSVMLTWEMVCFHVGCFTWLGVDHWQDVTVGSLLGLGICESGRVDDRARGGWGFFLLVDRA
jgi:hypothetical protein